mgnify:FL=1|jgi:hypothetical protein|tara:strand:- start:1358 stop:2050 length:693 start_codon:yes stop_codon:yes gene_type:complete
MDPVSTMAAASAAFSALKKGFAIGRDIESMASDLSRWMGALSDLDQAEKEAKNPPIFKKLFGGQSVEQEAVAAFAAKKKAQEQRYELQQWISLTMGKSKWDELVRMEGQIRKRRQETLYRQRERRRKFVEIVAWVIMIGAGIAVLTAFVLLLKSHTARAEQMVTCRKVKCEKLDDRKLVCVFRGANNTIESQFFEYLDFVPNEYQCKYDPNARKDVTIQETLKEIRKSRD